MRRQLTTLAFTLALATLSAADARAQQSPEYRAVIAEALLEFEAERWSEARVLFAHAFEIYPNARALRGLGMSAFELRDYVAAIAAFRSALEHPTEPLTRSQRRHVQNLLARSSLFVGRMAVTTEPSNATVLIDGAPPTLQEGTALVNEGSHQLRVDAEGYLSDTQRVDVVAGQLVELSVTLAPVRPEPAPAPAPQPTPARPPLAVEDVADASDGDERPGRIAGFTVLSVGVAAGVASLVTGLVAHRRHQDLSAECPDGPCPPELQNSVDQGERFGRTSTALMGAAVVGVGVGITLLLLSRGGDASDESDRDDSDNDDARAARSVIPSASVTRREVLAGVAVRF